MTGASPDGLVGDDGLVEIKCPNTATHIETLLSGPGLAREHRHFGGMDLSAAQIASAAAQGDAACQATLQRYAARLARALASVINLLDPDVIVLGGGLSQMAMLYEQVPRLWGRWVFCGVQRDAVRTRLLRSRHGDASGVRGAAWLGREAGAPPALPPASPPVTPPAA